MLSPLKNFGKVSNELLSQTTFHTCHNSLLESYTKSSQAQKTSYCMAPFVWNVQKRWTHRDRATTACEACSGIVNWALELSSLTWTSQLLTCWYVNLMKLPNLSKSKFLHCKLEKIKVFPKTGMKVRWENAWTVLSPGSSTSYALMDAGYYCLLL